MKNKAALDKAELIAQLAAEKKGENIVLMDMTKISTVCDWFVLISASSARRINAISKNIKKELSKKHLSPLSIEGKQSQYWTLMDYEDVVVHIFYDQIREFYGLERLWSDAPRHEYNEKCIQKTSQKV